MTAQGTPITILVADADPDDRLLTRDALVESRLANDIHFVCDGEELMDYLLRRGAYAALAGRPLPGMILLDLNMPRKDGREALHEIKAHPALSLIPVVILTTSKCEEDMLRSYNLGVNYYLTKPVLFEGLVQTLKILGRYWLEIVDLPAERKAA